MDSLRLLIIAALSFRFHAYGEWLNVFGDGERHILKNTQEMSFDDAEASCQTKGGHLAHFEVGEGAEDPIDSVIKRNANGCYCSWIGAKRVNPSGDEWCWTDESLPSFTTSNFSSYWGDEEPTDSWGRGVENCISYDFWFLDGKAAANDKRCKITCESFCEVPHGSELPELQYVPLNMFVYQTDRSNSLDTNEWTLPNYDDPNKYFHFTESPFYNCIKDAPIAKGIVTKPFVYAIARFHVKTPTSVHLHVKVKHHIERIFLNGMELNRTIEFHRSLTFEDVTDKIIRSSENVVALEIQGDPGLDTCIAAAVEVLHKDESMPTGKRIHVLSIGAQHEYELLGRTCERGPLHVNCGWTTGYEDWFKSVIICTTVVSVVAAAVAVKIIKKKKQKTKKKAASSTVCKYCNRKFSRVGNKNQHVKRVHLKRKEFCCTIGDCSQAFYSKYLCDRHVSNVHLGIRNYICLKCGLQFGQENNLKAHEKTHQGPLNWRCNYCQKPYSSKRNKEIHGLKCEQRLEQYPPHIPTARELSDVFDDCTPAFTFQFNSTTELREEEKVPAPEESTLLNHAPTFLNQAPPGTPVTGQPQNNTSNISHSYGTTSIDAAKQFADGVFA